MVGKIASCCCRASLTALMSAILVMPAAAVTHHNFTITVVNKLTGTPIAGMPFSTTNSITYVTDGNGKVEIYEPGVMGQTVYFGFNSCDIPNGETQGTCSHNGTVCDAHGDCNAGWEPPKTPFFGSCFVGSALAVSEKGRVTLRMCPNGTTTLCGGASCTPDILVQTPANNSNPGPANRFKITVVDSVTGRGVPLIQVTTPNATYETDSNGVLAFFDQPLMGNSVQFNFSGHGYAPTSATLVARRGNDAEVTITRNNIAERMYRVTGGGIYRETVVMQEPAPLALPVLNAQVFGQDSVQSTVYKGKAFYIWGDTNRPSHPLGIFRAAGARSDLTGAGALDPSVGINLNYFTAAGGFVKEMCPTSTVPNPPGYTNLLCWMGGLASVKDSGGAEKLYGGYALVAGLAAPIESGLARFNDTTELFEKQLVFNPFAPAQLSAQPDAFSRTAGTPSLYYIGKSAPGFVQGDNPVRVLATEAALLNQNGYEVFTALQQGSDTVLEYNPDGTLSYTWKTGTKPITNPGVGPTLPADQRLYGHEKDPDTGTGFLIHNSSTAWNAYRKRWVQSAQQVGGPTSFLGELWFAEADTPVGPWVYARKTVTHNNYSFYNIRHHPFFDANGGRKIFFEGTYTTFLTSSAPTPRYNYNQVMYRLDLDDPRVTLPVAVYDLSAATVPGRFATKEGLRPTTPNSAAAFFAKDRGTSETVPVYWSNASCENPVLIAGGTPITPPVFHALPANAPSPPSTTVPLYEYVNSGSGERAYSVNPSLSLPGFTLNPSPLARVWQNPIRLTLPAADYLPSLIADAGSDICHIEGAPGSGGVVQLNGTQSSHANGTISSYQWTWPGGSASGPTAVASFAVGTHTATLTVTGSDGSTSTDTVVIDIDPCPSGCCDPSSGCC